MNRPATSQTVIDEFTKIIDSQDGKGFAKYGKSIDEAIDKDYNWELMALEETADLQKYLVRRIKELEKEKEQWKELFYLLKSDHELLENWQTNEWMVKARELGIDV